MHGYLCVKVQSLLDTDSNEFDISCDQILLNVSPLLQRSVMHMIYFRTPSLERRMKCNSLIKVTSNKYYNELTSPSQRNSRMY